MRLRNLSLSGLLRYGIVFARLSSAIWLDSFPLRLSLRLRSESQIFVASDHQSTSGENHSTGVIATTKKRPND